MVTLSNSNFAPRSGGHILADQLKPRGVDKVFCVPGESHLPLLDGLYDHLTASRRLFVGMRVAVEHGRCIKDTKIQ